MIDSVLKGTGNSRFLKSAVPAGTSWADALAMLQAGTFPIDFNGINTEGFQQVGTPLNKANLLKDATAAQIGLPPSTTPDGMFQALGNTGELHVWRKTVKNAADVPAGYNLGVKTTKTILNTTGDSGGSSAIYYSSSVSVSDSGTVSLKNPTSTSVSIYTSSLPIVGKFFYIDLSSVQTSDLIQKKIYFVPSDTDISVDDSPKAFSGVVQEVTGYAKVPAGTTTTYPVSTNPKTYQEGDDAKEAGYTLGDATSMKVISYVGSSGWYVRFYTADSVTVSTDGVPSIIEDNNSASMISKSSDGSELKGKYIKYHSSYGANTELVEGMIYFVPSDALFTKSNELLTCNKVQLVTGYAAIPAGTTIEYLGKLGDKARVQVVSYVGTGTYGKNNPCSITADFKINTILFLSFLGNNGNMLINNYATRAMIGDVLTTEYVASRGFSDQNSSYPTYGKKSADGKTFSWYHEYNSSYQCNNSGFKYYYLVISN